MPKKNEAQMTSELDDCVDDYFNQNEVIISLSKIKKPEQPKTRGRIEEIRSKKESTEENQPRFTKKAQITEIEPIEPITEEGSPNQKTNTENNPTENTNQTPGCNHYIGYLKVKGKEQKIPEECIACPRSIECLIGKGR